MKMELGLRYEVPIAFLINSKLLFQILCQPLRSFFAVSFLSSGPFPASDPSSLQVSLALDPYFGR